MSETLAWDLNLPMTTGPPFLPDLLQAFVICVGRPPLLLTLWDKGDHSAEVETYCSETARVLHWSLLHFCHLDFTVLRVSATQQDFLRETVSLEEEVKAKAAKARRYFKSPMNLTEDTFTVLRDAATALVGATFVPCLLEDVPRDEVRNSHCLSLCLCLSVILCFYVVVSVYISPFFSWRQIDGLWRGNKIGTKQILSVFIGSLENKESNPLSRLFTQSHWYYSGRAEEKAANSHSLFCSRKKRLTLS